jgi:hypothetical protein
MEFTATHAYHRPLDEVVAAFLDPDVHVARYALMGHRDIEVLHVSRAEGVLELTTVRTVEGEVPKAAQKLISATNTVTTTDRWERRADGALVGRSVIEASNVPGTATIDATVATADDGGTTYDLVLTLSLKVPLIGDRFVALMRPQVMEIVDAEFAAWDRWFARVEAA